MKESFCDQIGFCQLDCSLCHIKCWSYQNSKKKITRKIMKFLIILEMNLGKLQTKNSHKANKHPDMNGYNSLFIFHL